MWGHNVNQFEFRAHDVYGIAYKMFKKSPRGLPLLAWYKLPNCVGSISLRLIVNDEDVLGMFEAMRA